MPSIRALRRAVRGRITGQMPGGSLSQFSVPFILRPEEALTADEAIACIQTAVAAQAGYIKEVEGDDDGGKRLCEVKIVDQTRKRHTLHIDVQTKQVVKTK